MIILSPKKSFAYNVVGMKPHTTDCVFVPVSLPLYYIYNINNKKYIAREGKMVYNSLNMITKMGVVPTGTKLI